MSSRPPHTPQREVCLWILRAMFNEGQYLERVTRGELEEVIKRSYAAPPGAGEPPGTLCQVLRYVNASGEVVARAFRYLRPDGAIGGPTGDHDPKWIRQGSEALVPGHNDAFSCPECAIWSPRAKASSPAR